MISYIVTSNNQAVLNDNLLKNLNLIDKDEMIIIDDAKSIFEAYNRGIRKAKNRVKCFVHHDVIITDPDGLRNSLVEHCREDIGMVGVIGSTDPDACPWWDQGDIGSVVSVGLGLIKFDRDSGYCSLLDGLVLATLQDFEFDEAYKSFHFYDHDICRQMLQKGLRNFCLPNGHKLLSHNSPQTNNLQVSWLRSMARYKSKWRIKGSNRVEATNSAVLSKPDAELHMSTSISPMHDLRTASKLITKDMILLKVIGLNQFYTQHHRSLALSLDEGPGSLLKQYASRAGLDLIFLAPSGQDHVAAVSPRKAYNETGRKTSIVMLSYGKGEYTEKAIRSIHKHTKTAFEIIVVDNNPADAATVDILKKLSGQGLIHRLILNTENVGVPCGWNQGLKEATGEYFMVLNNDIIVTPGWLLSLINCLETEPNAGCVGNRTNSITGPQLVFNAPSNENVEKLLLLFSEEWQSLHRNGWWKTYRIRGLCMLFRKEVFREMEGFDKAFGQGNFEDDDICLRLLKAGYDLFIVDDSYVHHFGSLSFGSHQQEYQNLLLKNQDYFIKKWKPVEPEWLKKVSTMLANRRMADYTFDLESLLTPGKERNYQVRNAQFAMQKEVMDLYL